MQHKAGPRLLATDRQSALYLERARVEVQGDRVIYYGTDDDLRRSYNIPHVNVAVLFLGQGTSITQDAMRLLGEEHVHVAFTGSGGAPLHMGALTTYTATRHFRAMLAIYVDPVRSLVAARSVMRDRTARMKKIGALYAQKYLKTRETAGLARLGAHFEQGLEDCATTMDLLGREGEYAKACYKEFAQISGISKSHSFRREPGLAQHDHSDAVSRINHLIDHGNYLCYGMAGAALWAAGIPPHMAIFHGKTRAGGLVFDLADSFKDALVLPLAFSVGKDGGSDYEKKFREKVIQAFDDTSVLSECFQTLERMFAAAGVTEKTILENTSGTGGDHA